ncbi:hypothetical protein HMPREF1248_1478 [Coriobacteriaceae bacterium BV3Ac1]|nr:nucleotidyltransferase [Olegusella massiliensis]ERL12738.1 hypothetical protein HMPREF1248_1478 [Coriobacteriaceae bacterium BV3Ac1]MBS5865457.1 nucleotidyltransferase [Coriobacteriaceae bacterium]
MSLQSQFKEFNKKIALSKTEQEELRNKRSVLTDKLRSSKDMPVFDDYCQGSYATHLGVKPVDDREYDIDIALMFNINATNHNPYEIKSKIAKVLKGHNTTDPKIKDPCVTMTYIEDGNAKYHLDLVTYSYQDSESNESQPYLARGKAADEAEWEEADPKGLINYINKTIADADDPSQLRRVIRYLKRWKTLKFSPQGDSEPPSIGITLIALEGYKNSPGNDLLATIDVVNAIKNRFYANGLDTSGNEMWKIAYPLPDSLYFKKPNDVFEKMSTVQQRGFHQKIETLLNGLIAVQNEPDIINQCKKLRKIFGDDFKIPDEASTSRRQSNFFPSSSHSG